ncbi:MAG: hypothetical protein WC761_04460 [Candidatus Paceibacterota bacterium]|jgi:hypothetical protein
MKTLPKSAIALIAIVIILLLIAVLSSVIHLTPGDTIPEESLELKVATSTDIVPDGAAIEITKTDGVKPPVTKWQVYENKDYKFKFSYPTGWIIGSNVFDDRRSVFALSLCPKELSLAGDCKVEQKDGKTVSLAPFLVYVTNSESGPSTSQNKVVWERSPYTYEISYNTSGFDDLYEEILPTFKVLP